MDREWWRLCRSFINLTEWREWRVTCQQLIGNIKHTWKNIVFFHVCCYGFSQGWKSWYNTVVCMIKYFPIFASPKLAKISRFPNLGDGRVKLVFFDQNFTDCFIRQSQTHLALKSRCKITKDLARISTTQERNFFRADLSAFWSTLATCAGFNTCDGRRISHWSYLFFPNCYGAHMPRFPRKKKG